MELKCVKKQAQLKLINELCNKICTLRTNVVPTGQNMRSPHTTPNVTLMTFARSNVGTLTAIAIAIAPTTTNAERQSAPAVATGRMTVATISLKS